MLLVGGTDGGNAEVLHANARALGIARIAAPVVVAGNAEAAPRAAAELERRRRRVVVAPNVLPRIGTLEPLGARSAIRELFLAHVIGGKGLSRGPRFARLVRAPTPDAVLTGVEVLAEVTGDVLVVDVGGATTDVYSVLTTPADQGAAAGTAAATRTVEGDLGVRWSAPAASRLPAPRDCSLRARTRRSARTPPRSRPTPGGSRPDPRTPSATCASPSSPSPWRCAGTAARRHRRRARGRCATSGSSSAAEACCATRGLRAGVASWPRHSPTTPADGGSPSRRGPPSTGDTCCSQPACWPPSTRLRHGRSSVVRR